MIDLSLKFNVFFTNDLNNNSFDEDENLEVENYSEVEEFIKNMGEQLRLPKQPLLFINFTHTNLQILSFVSNINIIYISTLEISTVK